jgi:hypothetical protein
MKMIAQAKKRSATVLHVDPRFTFWKNGPEIASGELVTSQIGTEVFFLPAAAHVETDGSFTNTQRLLQWHAKAPDPPGDARSDLSFIFRPGRAGPGLVADPKYVVAAQRRGGRG